jgi:hypothetical protein
LGGAALAASARGVRAAETPAPGPAAGQSALPKPVLTPVEEIERRVNESRPLRGGPIPADLPRRLGATHYHGQYYLTREPFLIEGCKKLRELGMGVAKLWFGPDLPGYSHHSDWRLAPGARLAEVARHPYFVEAFGMPFNAFALEIQRVRGSQGAAEPPGREDRE